MKQENYTELQLLKRQVNELRDEVYNLKNSFKSISYKSYNDQTLGRFIGKTIGNTIFKNNNSASIKNGLMQLRSEKDIERLINFIERGTVADIPSYLTKNKEWKDIRNQTVRELKGIGIGKGKVVTD